MRTIDELLLPTKFPATRANAEKTRRRIPLTEDDLQKELSEARTCYAENTDPTRRRLVSQHIASLEAAIQYKRNHPSHT